MPIQRPSGPVTLFYSYAREDESLRDQLEKHLSILKRQGYLSTWYDRDIRAGDDWARKIDTHLENAQIILLLISADFLASDYCYSVEMQRALERHFTGEARVIPIILRPVDWKQDHALRSLQALPADGKPVINWPFPPHYDAAFEDIAKGIRKALKDFQNGQGEREQQLQPSSAFFSPPSSKKRSRQKMAILVGITLPIVLLFSAILWKYAFFAEGTPSTLATMTTTVTTAPSGSIYTVKNTGETQPDGVYFRHSLQSDPNTPTPTPTPNFGVFKGDQVRVFCWTWDDDMYGTRVWYYTYNITRPTVAGRSNKGWLSAHYVDDHMAANHPAPGIPQCGSPLPIGG